MIWQLVEHAVISRVCYKKKGHYIGLNKKGNTREIQKTNVKWPCLMLTNPAVSHPSFLLFYFDFIFLPTAKPSHPSLLLLLFCCFF